MNWSDWNEEIDDYKTEKWKVKRTVRDEIQD